MGIAYHTLYTPDGAAVNLFDRVNIGTVSATYPAVTTTGTATTLTVTWSEPIPTPYVAIMTPIEDSTYFITSPTTKSFILNVSPRLGTGTLTGGTAEILLIS